MFVCAAYGQLPSLAKTRRERRGEEAENKEQKEGKQYVICASGGDLDTGEELPINALPT